MLWKSGPFKVLDPPRFARRTPIRWGWEAKTNWCKVPAFVRQFGGVKDDECLQKDWCAIVLQQLHVWVCKSLYISCLFASRAYVYIYVSLAFPMHKHIISQKYSPLGFQAAKSWVLHAENASHLYISFCVAFTATWQTTPVNLLVMAPAVCSES